MPDQTFIETGAKGTSPTQKKDRLQDRGFAGAIGAMDQVAARLERQLGPFDAAEILETELRQRHPQIRASSA